MRRSLLIALVLIAAATAASVAAGFMLQKPEEEKAEGLSDAFDAATDGTIGYVSYSEGKAGIHLRNPDGTLSGPLAETATDRRIADLSFSPDGRTIAYSVVPKDPTKGVSSTVRFLDTESGTDEAALEDDGMITEIRFDPDDPDRLYLLRAAVFENYSPVAAPHPHDFDVHLYRLSDRSMQALTDLKAYEMQSLNVPAGDSVFFSMFGDEEAETAEETFEAKLGIYRVASGGTPERVDLDVSEDVYDFLILPDGDIIYQAVAKTSDSGIFEYELFRFDRASGKSRQLTRLKTHAGKPIAGPGGEMIWFLENTGFATSRPDFHLKQMPADGGPVTDIPLD